MEFTQIDMAIASEGSFGMHPSIPFAQSNLELVLFIDKKNGFEIRGHYSTIEVNSGGEYIIYQVRLMQSVLPKSMIFHKQVLF